MSKFYIAVTVSDEDLINATDDMDDDTDIKERLARETGWMYDSGIFVERIYDDEEFNIKTPAGTLTFATFPLDDYPGIDISCDGERVAIVEHDPDHGLRTIAYNKTDDEPISITEWEE